MDNIHDNEIVKYSVDFIKKEIVIKTLNEKNETLKILFQNVLVYCFEKEMPNSIIFDIEKFEIEKLIEENIELLKENKDYGWPPIAYNNTKGLVEQLKTEQYNYYTIEATIGLCGWIVAKKVQIKKEDL